MKVLFPFVGDTVGGSHVASCILIKVLRDRGSIEPIVLVHERGALEGYLAGQGIECSVLEAVEVVREGNFFSQLVSMLRAVKLLGAFIRSHGIDIVHTNDLRMHFTWVLAVRLSGAKHVWHQHSCSGSWRLAVLSFFTSRVITISDYCRQSFPYLFRRKAEVLFNPFEGCEISAAQKEVYRKAMRDEIGVDGDAKIIGFVGNLTAQKRPDFFVSLVAHLPDFHFVLVGEKRSEMYTRLMEKIRADGTEKRVHFLGARFPVEPSISAFDVLVAPAKNEGFGRAIVEAMLCGVPIVASRHGGHVEIIEHEQNGFIIDADRIDLFLESALNLVNDLQVRDSFVLKAKRYADDMFGVSSYCDKIERIYEVK